MIRHILLLKQRATATAEAVDAARAALAALVGPIPGLVNFHWGPNHAPAERQAGYTHGFSMDFVDQPSLDAYAPHPQHQAAVAKVREAFEATAVLDFAL